MSNQETALRGEDYSTQRLNQRYRFADPNMDLFFLGALGWGPTGGLSVGEAFHVATQINDGDPDSWALAFQHQGEELNRQADVWRERGNVRAAGEARLKAFASYRSSWQFVTPGERFTTLFRISQKHFDQAMMELGLPSTAFAVSYGGGELPGHFFRGSDPSAPTILVIGGADTCHEDRFLSQGRYYLDRGYSVALVDLPGQGLVPVQGLHWEPEAERSIAAVIDHLVSHFGVVTDRLALLGMSLGGYFACRAAAYEPRLAAVIATPALPRPLELIANAARPENHGVSGSAAARNNYQVLMWKAGATDFSDMVKRWEATNVDPRRVHVPFLSVLGAQEGGVWKKQTEEWHASIPSPEKNLVILDAKSGADAHCQGNNPLRLVQEVDGWLERVLKKS